MAAVTRELVFTDRFFVLTMVAVAASFFPARRATRLHPVVALRYE